MGIMDSLMKGAKEVGIKAVNGLDGALDSITSTKKAVQAPPPKTPQEEKNSDLIGNIQKKNQALKDAQ